LILIVQGRKPSGEQSRFPKSATRRGPPGSIRESVPGYHWMKLKAITSGDCAEMWPVTDGGSQMTNVLRSGSWSREE
jgi:hypothetical protein